jgi:hypothetical protein
MCPKPKPNQIEKSFIFLKCDAENTIISFLSFVYKQQDKQLQMTVKVFANDFEKSLRKTTGKAIDLFNPKDKVELETQIKAYIKACVAIQVNNKTLEPRFLGYEIENEACYIYLEANDCGLPQQMVVTNKLLYDSFCEQSNIVEVEVGSTKTSARETYPNTRMVFNFPLGNQ